MEFLAEYWLHIYTFMAVVTATYAMGLGSTGNGFTEFAANVLIGVFWPFFLSVRLLVKLF